jgi:hypothetical protein
MLAAPALACVNKPPAISVCANTINQNDPVASGVAAEAHGYANGLEGVADLGSGVHGVSARGNGVLGISHHTQAAAVSAVAAGGGIGVYAESRTGSHTAGQFVGDVNVSGRTRTATLEITGGADLAEPFHLSRRDIPQGAVLVIDADRPGSLTLSEQAYDTRVAGIVSGANGIHPGISLRQEGSLEGDAQVALSGRVYVLADAGAAPIRPGDLLTTSATPGHAMRVTEHERARGAVLGKAMTGLAAGRGMVLVLVGLQ